MGAMKLRDARGIQINFQGEDAGIEGVRRAWPAPTSWPLQALKSETDPQMFGYPV